MKKNKAEPTGLAIIRTPGGEIIEGLCKKAEWGYTTVTIWFADGTIRTTGVNNVLIVTNNLEGSDDE